MPLLGSALLILACAVRMVMFALSADSDYRRIRRDGVQLQAEVVDYDKRPGSNRGDYHLYPVLRYYLDDRSYQSTLRNPTTDSVPPLGSFLTVVVSPSAPHDPYDPYAGTARSVGFACGVLLLALAYTTWAASRL